MFNQTANAPQNARLGGIGAGSAVSMLIPIETLVRDVNPSIGLRYVDK